MVGECNKKNALKTHSVSAHLEKKKPRGSSKYNPSSTPHYIHKKHIIEHHGDKRVDPFFWLRERKDPSVKKLLNEENFYTEAFFSAHKGISLKRRFFSEMKSRLKEEDVSLPTLDRNFWYYTRLVKNADYPLYCRRPYNLEKNVNSNFAAEVAAMLQEDPKAILPPFEDENIFLDLNILAQDLHLDFVEIGDMDLSPDEKYVAVTIDCANGKEIYTIFIFPADQDVNYSKWIDESAGEFDKAWAYAMAEDGKSIYTPLTSSSFQGSPVTSFPSLGVAQMGDLHGAASRSGKSCASPNSSLRGNVSSQKKNLPLTSKSEESLPHSKREVDIECGANLHVADDSPNKDAEGEEQQSKSKLWTLPTPLSSPKGPRGQRSSSKRSTIARPSHTIVRQIDMFDISTDVLWISHHTLLYVGLDEKIRPFRLIFHDIRFPVDHEHADVICYEEENESFWISYIGFSADDAYLLFNTSSTEISEWFLLPVQDTTDSFHGDGKLTIDSKKCLTRPVVNGIPLIGNLHPVESLPATDLAPTLESVLTETDSSKAVGFSPLPLYHMQCFAKRSATPLEYDLDHHRTLFGPLETRRGAWIITTNAKELKNYAAFYVLDTTIASALETSSTLSTPLTEPDQWLPLFAYNPDVKLESLESLCDYLLLSVRWKGILRVLFCPLTLLWDRWEQQDSSTSGDLKASPSSYQPLLYDDLLDFAHLLCSFSPSSGLSASPCPPIGPTMLENSDPSLKCCEVSALLKLNHLKEENPSLFLPYSLTAIDTQHSDSSFYSLKWRLCVTHLIHPAILYEISFTKPSRFAVRDTSKPSDHGTLSVRKIREEYVSGSSEYSADEYNATILWVPSDFAFSSDTLLPDSVEDTKNAPPFCRPLPTEVPVTKELVPVYLCWRRDQFRPGTNPLFLNVYGSYGDAFDVEFSSVRLSLLDRGFIWGFAAVRGGGELGTPWYDSGKKYQRATSINDFLSVASFLQYASVDSEYLPPEDRNNSSPGSWCEKGRLVSYGGSAGGTIVSSAMISAPFLFCGVIAACPFVDCLTSLLDKDLPLTISDWEEYGNPIEDPKAYRFIKAVSPIDNVPTHDTGVIFPHLLLETSWDDSRVGYWESMAFTARLREIWGSSTNSGRVLLHWCDFDSGHGGSTGRFQHLKETAREYAFATLVSSLK